jgi:hypothetical protein
MEGKRGTRVSRFKMYHRNDPRLKDKPAPLRSGSKNWVKGEKKPEPTKYDYDDTVVEGEDLRSGGYTDTVTTSGARVTMRQMFNYFEELMGAEPYSDTGIITYTRPAGNNLYMTDREIATFRASGVNIRIQENDTSTNSTDEDSPDTAGI